MQCGRSLRPRFRVTGDAHDQVSPKLDPRREAWRSLGETDARVTEQVSAYFEPAAQLMLALIRHAELRKVERFRLQARHYVVAGLKSRGARSRALRSLEKKRLIRVFREPGRYPVIELNKDHRGLVIPWPNDFLQVARTDRPP